MTDSRPSQSKSAQVEASRRIFSAPSLSTRSYFGKKPWSIHATNGCCLGGLGGLSWSGDHTFLLQISHTRSQPQCHCSASAALPVDVRSPQLGSFYSVTE